MFRKQIKSFGAFPRRMFFTKSNSSLLHKLTSNSSASKNQAVVKTLTESIYGHKEGLFFSAVKRFISGDSSAGSNVIPVSADKTGLTRISVPLPSGTSVFSLTPECTARSLIQDILAEDPSIKNAGIYDLASGAKLAQSTPMGAIVKYGFQLDIDGNKYLVQPVQAESSASNVDIDADIQKGNTQLRKADFVHLQRMIDDAIAKNMQEDRLHQAIMRREAEQRKLKSIENQIASHEQQVAALEAKLQPLKREKERLDADAHRHANRVIYAGLVFLLSQMAVVARLTWWELSWDIMEPITYMLTFGTVCIGYAFFAVTRTEYTFQALHDMIARRRMSKNYQKAGFDLNKYTSLVDQILQHKDEIEKLKNAHHLLLTTAITL